MASALTGKLRIYRARAPEFNLFGEASPSHRGNPVEQRSTVLRQGTRIHSTQPRNPSE